MEKEIFYNFDFETDTPTIMTECSENVSQIKNCSNIWEQNSK
jgi:hypothetical protein